MLAGGDVQRKESRLPFGMQPKALAAESGSRGDLYGPFSINASESIVVYSSAPAGFAHSRLLHTRNSGDLSLQVPQLQGKEKNIANAFAGG